MMRTWKAKMACCMPWKDFSAGETCELDDDQVTDRVKALFVCVEPEQAKKEAEEKKDSSSPEYKVMLQRLRQAKVNIPRYATKAQVEELWRTCLQDGTLPVAD